MHLRALTGGLLEHLADDAGIQKFPHTPQWRLIIDLDVMSAKNDLTLYLPYTFVSTVSDNALIMIEGKW
jgi:hypothetical protein